MESKEKKSLVENVQPAGKRPVFSWPLLLAGLGLIALLAISCGDASGKQDAEDPAENEPQASVGDPQAAPEEPGSGTALENPSLGDEDAPVALIEYGDFQ